MRESSHVLSSALHLMGTQPLRVPAPALSLLCLWPLLYPSAGLIAHLLPVSLQGGFSMLPL